MKTVLFTEEYDYSLVSRWRYDNPHIEPYQCTSVKVGFNRLNRLGHNDWLMCSKPYIKDMSPNIPMASDKFDVIIFYASEAIRSPNDILDINVLRTIESQGLTTNKGIARRLNLNCISTDVAGEWTYIDVMKLHSRGKIVHIAMRPEIVEQLDSTRLTMDESFWLNVDPELKIGFVLDRFAKTSSSFLDRFSVWEVFEETPRIKIDDDCQIVTACDDNLFKALELMLTSIHYTHDADVLVWDLGLTGRQSEWIKSLGFTVKKFQDEHSLIIEEGVKGWQTWNKPLYIKHADKRKVLWIDADAMVLRSLRPAFKYIEDKSILIVVDSVSFVYSSNPRANVSNTLQLYKWLPTPVRMKLGFPNCGVLGMDRESHKSNDILNAWLNCVDHAKNDYVRKEISWYDQGAFIWALEKTNNINVVEPDIYWNDCVNWNRYGQRFCSNMREFFKIVPGLDSGIIHFAGRNKPWGDDYDWVK